MRLSGGIASKCPECGHKYEIPIEGELWAGNMNRKTYNALTHNQYKRPPGGWSQPITPADPVTMSVKVPALRAGIFAVAGGGIVLAGLRIFHASNWLFWWLVITLAIFLLLFRQPKDAPKSKGSNSAKLRRDGPPPTINLTMAADGGVVMHRLHLESCTEKQLRALAVSYTSGRSVAQSAMSGTGRPFTRGTYDNTRDELIEKGYARWNSEHGRNQGWQPTAKGIALFRGLAGHK